MKRITAAAVIAVASLGAFAAQAASVPAGSLLNNRELSEAKLSATDLVDVTVGQTVQVRAGDLMSQRELSVAGIKADDILTVSTFAKNAPVQQQATLR